MKKTIKLQDLDCANCAAKLERAVACLAGVTNAQVNFMSQKMILEAPEEQYAEILEAAKREAKKIDRAIEFLD